MPPKRRGRPLKSPAKKKLKTSNPNEADPGEGVVNNGAQPMEDVVIVPNAEAGARAANGNALHMYFMAVGQGDCTVLITPSNEIFILDMGTAGEERTFGNADRTWTGSRSSPKTSATALKNFLNQPQLLGTNKAVEAIILSHSDRDHYNLLGILQDLNVTAKQIYHSDRLAKFTRTTKTTAAGKGVSVRDLLPTLRRPPQGGAVSNDQIRSVTYTTGKAAPTPVPAFNTLNDKNVAEAVKKSEEKPKDNFMPVPTPYQAFMSYRAADCIPIPTQATAVNGAPPYWDQANGVTIYNNQATGCTLRLLVSNYRNYADCYALSNVEGTGKESNATLKKMRAKNYDRLTTENATEPRNGSIDINRASSVVYISCAGENYMICGDSTGGTQNMILNEYPTITGINLLRIPHHGAEKEGCSSPNFVNTMNPCIVVSSSLRIGYGQGHPRKIALCRYQSRMTTSKYSTPNNVRYGWFRDVGSANTGDYLAWPASSGNKPSNKFFYQFNDQPFPIYVTGWMAAGYYHYQAGGAENYPGADAFRPTLVAPKPNVDTCPPPTTEVEMGDE